MPVYTEKSIDKLTGKTTDKLIDGKKQYYIRTYITDRNGNRKQTTRHNKNWIGRDGFQEAQKELNRLTNNDNLYEENLLEDDIKEKEIAIIELRDRYLDYLKGRIDSDSLKTIKTRLSHFCEVDGTKQVHTHPKMESKKYNKNLYLKWQNEMKDKKYLKGKIWFPYSIKQLNRINDAVANMIDYAIIDGYCTVNFAKQAGKIGTTKELKMCRVNKVYQTIDYDEYTRLMEASRGDLRYNTYFCLEFTRGPRIGEIRAFQVKYHDRKNKTLMVEHTLSKDNTLKDPKTASSKDYIFLGDELNEKLSLLIDSLRKMPDFNDNWYIFGGATPISANALEFAKTKYFKLANINKHIRNHDFRHSCATWLFSIGIDITVISKILRHASIDETMKTYTHLFKTDYENALKKIDIFLKQDQKQDQN